MKLAKVRVQLRGEKHWIVQVDECFIQLPNTKKWNYRDNNYPIGIKNNFENMCNENSYERLGGLKRYWVMGYGLENYAWEHREFGHVRTTLLILNLKKFDFIMVIKHLLNKILCPSAIVIQVKNIMDCLCHV
jgi:hypothetical protein